MMAKETTHICDGCEQRHTGEFPMMWRSVTVRVTSDMDGMPLTSGTYDLCDSCLDRLKLAATPYAWDRPGAVTANA